MVKTNCFPFGATVDPLMGEDKEEVIHHFGAQFYELRNIINKHDPLGLLEINGIHEYEPETKTIIIQLKPGMSMELIHILVYREFFRWISNERLIGPWRKYTRLARDIYFWLNGK